jgi:hypothetical protein
MSASKHYWETAEWRPIYELSRRNRKFAIVALCAYTALVIQVLFWSVRNAHPWVAFATVLMVTMAVEIGASLWQRGTWAPSSNWRNRPWSLLTYPILGLSVVFATHVWHTFPIDSFSDFYTGSLWWVGCLIKGVLLPAFVIWRGRTSSVQMINVLRLYAPSRLATEFAAWPGMAAVLTYPIFTALIEGWETSPGYTGLTAVCLLVWLGAFYADTRRINMLPGNPYMISRFAVFPQADERGKVIEPAIPGVPTLAQIRETERIS